MNMDADAIVHVIRCFDDENARSSVSNPPLILCLCVLLAQAPWHRLHMWMVASTLCEQLVKTNAEYRHNIQEQMLHMVTELSSDIRT